MLGGSAQRVSIFMNVFNVHVNRYPVSGTIIFRHYQRGVFGHAGREKAALENEHSDVGIECSRGKLLTRQIAGSVARRIVTDHALGATVAQGERMGLIRFGSRVDVFLPGTANILVKEGDVTQCRRHGHRRMEMKPPGSPQRTGMRRVVVVVPSAFTLGNLFFGFWAIVSAYNGGYLWAGWFIIFAGVLDGLDGRVARASNTGTRFGAELDSLVDVISFGIAPALLIYFEELSTRGPIRLGALLHVRGVRRAPPGPLQRHRRTGWPPVGMVHRPAVARRRRDARRLLRLLADAAVSQHDRRLQRAARRHRHAHAAARIPDGQQRQVPALPLGGLSHAVAAGRPGVLPRCRSSAG